MTDAEQLEKAEWFAWVSARRSEHAPDTEEFARWNRCKYDANHRPQGPDAAAAYATAQGWDDLAAEIAAAPWETP